MSRIGICNRFVLPWAMRSQARREPNISHALPNHPPSSRRIPVRPSHQVDDLFCQVTHISIPGAGCRGFRAIGVCPMHSPTPRIVHVVLGLCEADHRLGRTGIRRDEGDEIVQWVIQRCIGEVHIIQKLQSKVAMAMHRAKVKEQSSECFTKGKVVLRPLTQSRKAFWLVKCIEETLPARHRFRASNYKKYMHGFRGSSMSNTHPSHDASHTTRPS